MRISDYEAQAGDTIRVFGKTYVVETVQDYQHPTIDWPMRVLCCVGGYSITSEKGRYSYQVTRGVA